MLQFLGSLDYYEVVYTSVNYHSIIKIYSFHNVYLCKLILVLFILKHPLYFYFLKIEKY